MESKVKDLSTELNPSMDLVSRAATRKMYKRIQRKFSI